MDRQAEIAHRRTRSGQSHAWTFTASGAVTRTHQSTTDGGSPAGQKGCGQGSQALLHRPCADGESQRAMAVDCCVTQPTGRAESAGGHGDAGRGGRASTGSRWRPTRVTNRGVHCRGCRAFNVTPHVARSGRAARCLRTTGWPGYGISQRVRKRVEEIFGWLKTVGWPAQDPPSRSCPSWMDVHPRLALGSLLAKSPSRKGLLKTLILQGF